MTLLQKPRHMPRRQLLKLSSILPLSLPFTVTATQSVATLEKTNTAHDLVYAKINDAVSAPLLCSGDYVLVHSGLTHFQGEGIYFYPNWGKPRAYRVTQDSSGLLHFFNPQPSKQVGQFDQLTESSLHALWTIDLGSESPELFAGKAVGYIEVESPTKVLKLLNSFQPLTVPNLPVS